MIHSYFIHPNLTITPETASDEAQSLKASQLPRVSWPTLFKETFVNGTLSPTSILVPLMSDG